MSLEASIFPDQAQVVDVITYPIKSLPGVSRPEGAALTENGLEGDRLFILGGTTLDQDGTAPRLTLREHPELARIKPEYTDEGIVLTAEGVGRLLLPYNSTDEGHEDYEGDPVMVKSWGGAVMGTPVSPEANEWFGDYLRTDVQILAVPDRVRRRMAEEEQHPQATTFTGRATDGYPLHVVSIPSLIRLNETRVRSRLNPINVSHFRANIHIDGPDLVAFAEDQLPGMRLEDPRGPRNTVDIIAIKVCKRCVTVEVNPEGQKLGNVLKSIISLQPERTISEMPVFGTWAAPSRLSVGGIVRAGQLLHVTS